MVRKIKLILRGSFLLVSLQLSLVVVDCILTLPILVNNRLVVKRSIKMKRMDRFPFYDIHEFVACRETNNIVSNASVSRASATTLLSTK